MPFATHMISPSPNRCCNTNPKEVTQKNHWQKEQRGKERNGSMELKFEEHDLSRTWHNFFCLATALYCSFPKKVEGQMCHFLNDPLWSKSSLTQHPLIECNIPAQGQACSFKSLGAFTNNESGFFTNGKGLDGMISLSGNSCCYCLFLQMLRHTHNMCWNNGIQPPTSSRLKSTKKETVPPHMIKHCW
jgi:hypothetical protein